MDQNETIDTPPPQMRYYFSLHSRDAKIKALQEQVNALELKNEDLETEIFNLKRRNETLSNKITISSSASQFTNVLEEKDVFLYDRVEMAETEIKRLKDIVGEKEKRLTAKEVWIDALENVNLSLQKEVEGLQYRVKEQSESLARLTADTEAMEADVLLERAENIRKENAAFAKIEELELQLVEAKRMLVSEKEIVRQKDMEYEDNLAIVNCHAHKLSAKLNEAERKIQELEKNETCSVVNRANERKQLQSLLDSTELIRKTLANLDQEVRIVFAEYHNLLSGIKTIVPLESTDKKVKDMSMEVTDTLSMKHLRLLSDDEENYIFCKSLPEVVVDRRILCHDISKSSQYKLSVKKDGRKKGGGNQTISAKKLAIKWLHMSKSDSRKERTPRRTREFSII